MMNILYNTIHNSEAQYAAVFQIADINYDSWMNYDWLDDAYKKTLDRDILASNRLQCIDNPNYLTCYIQVGGKPLSKRHVVAFADLNVSKLPTIHIKTFYVHPDYKREGYGTELMKGIEFLAKRIGAEKLELIAIEKNIPAIKFYKALGFKITGGKDVKIGEKTYPCHLMSKILSKSKA